MDRKFALIGLALLCALAPLSQTDASMLIGRAGSPDYAPEVRLISPVGETVDLTGKDSLVLHWSWIEGDRMQRRYYDVRVYRGYDMVESTRIARILADPAADRVELDADLFQDGQVYTWSVRQRYYGMARSYRTYASFQVIKRAAPQAP